MLSDDALGHISIAGIITTGIEVAKRLNAPGLKWINQHSEGTSKAISAALAFITSFGFQMSWDGTWVSFSDLMSHGGTMNLMLVIPSVDTLVRAFGQMILNQAVYHGVVKPVAPKAA